MNLETLASKIGTIATPGRRRPGVSQEQFDKAAKARRAATGFVLVNRDEALLRGMKRYARRFEAGGDSTLAARLDGFAATAEAALQAMQEAKAQAEAPRTPHLKDAATVCGKALVRTMPGAFVDVNEAQAWAMRYLPLAEARRAEDQELAARMQAGKRAAKHRRDFLAAIEQCSILIFADSVVLEKNLRLLAEVGRDVA